MKTRIRYFITNNSPKEDSQRLFLKKAKDDSLFFGYKFDKDVLQFDELNDAKYFINNIFTFGYNIRIAKLQETLKGGVVIKRSYSTVKPEKYKFNLTLKEITKEDIDDLLFPEGKTVFKFDNLNHIINRRSYLKKLIIMKINALIDFHNMLDVKFSFVPDSEDEICNDDNCIVCKSIHEQVALLESVYLNKSLNNYNTVQKRFADADGKMNNWSKEDLQVLLYDFNDLVIKNPGMTVAEIADKYYQISKSSFYALIRQVRAYGDLDYLLSAMDNKKATKNI